MLRLVAFWLGASPSTYQYCWLIKCLTLFTMRWFSYRSRGLHYMMLEFCYAGNILAALQIFWVPSSPLLRRLAFAHMAGPLMWSIVAMRNSLVFHDVDKVRYGGQQGQCVACLGNRERRGRVLGGFASAQAACLVFSMEGRGDR